MTPQLYHFQTANGVKTYTAKGIQLLAEHITLWTSDTGRALCSNILPGQTRISLRDITPMEATS